MKKNFLLGCCPHQPQWVVCRFFRGHNHRIVLPKGIIEISMSLKCWRAKGIPMMVMLSSRPKNRCTNAVYNPPLKSQIILKRRDRQPVSFELLTTSLPKGHNTSPAILKHCKPQGMPTTVTHAAKKITQCRKKTTEDEPYEIAGEIHDLNVGYINRIWR